MEYIILYFEYVLVIVISIELINSPQRVDIILPTLWQNCLQIERELSILRIVLP